MSEIRTSEFSWTQVSHPRYNASRGSHAPEYLTDALVKALERTVAEEASDFNLQLWQRCEI